MIDERKKVKEHKDRIVNRKPGVKLVHIIYMKDEIAIIGRTKQLNMNDFV